MNQRYDVLLGFVAEEAICGRERKFQPGDIIACELQQHGPTIVIEADTTFYIVDRLLFKACCKFRNEGGSLV
jgi:hypothetical protein